MKKKFIRIQRRHSFLLLVLRKSAYLTCLASKVFYVETSFHENLFSIQSSFSPIYFDAIAKSFNRIQVANERKI